MRTADPDGTAFGPYDFVVGNEVGAQIGSLKTAWRATCRGRVCQVVEKFNASSAGL
jgi:hypothetical protein